MCGNAVNFYSTPSINDNLGNPIGNAAQADMARTWRERAAEMAKLGLHRVAYFAGDACVNQVCIPSHFGSQNEVIKRVVFNTIDNNQANAAWTCATTTGYSDFTNLSTTVTRGANHNITITPNYSFADSKVGVWIDFNRDGILSSSEKVGTFSGTGPWTTAIAVPATATLGSTRMRVRLQYSPSVTSESCDGLGWSGGETEDYTINISAVVPITLTDFKGENTENGNSLRWQTVTEIQSSHFEIERSWDGQKFESIGRMAAQGKTDFYAFLDKNSTAQLTYYRLKMVNKDGSFDYSKIISLLERNAKSAYSLFPNPTKGSLTLQISAYTEGSIQVSFLNVMGQKVLEISQKTVEGLNKINLDLSALPNGVYVGEILENGKPLQNLKVIKN
jgi:GEVED domain/Secretion system C-terminal sorting domain